MNPFLESVDAALCIRCLWWPPQAADWPSRNRIHGWPDSATVDRVINDGCDVVEVAHRQCRQHEWMGKHQWRLSFSRAEIILLNDWILEQQIVYHMLRVFVKTERLTDSTGESGAETLSNYHIKTLMLWACELKSRSWWIDDLNVVRICVQLLHILAVWLTEARCKHYFINKCNLVYHSDNWQLIASRLTPETHASLAEWFIRKYICKCARQHCPELKFDDVSSTYQLQNAVLEVVDWRENTLSHQTWNSFRFFQMFVAFIVSQGSLTMLSCTCWIRNLAKMSPCPLEYFTAITFLYVAYKITRRSLEDELLDILFTTCLQFHDRRRCINARHSSVLSLSQAAKLMKVVANNSRSTVQLIEIELSKAYLLRALRCKDSNNSDSIYCLANVYLAALYYTTGQYQTAIDHCTLVIRSQDHSQCSSHVVQGELLPKIDDNIDSVLGLATFYHYVRTAAFNQQQRHVSVFTTDLFAHYLHIKCLSVGNSHQLTQPSSSAGDIQRYQNCFCEFQEIFIADILIYVLENNTRCLADCESDAISEHQTMTVRSHQLDTSELCELLQQSAVEYLTSFRHLEEREFGSVAAIVTTDFEALYAYKCGDYQRCLRLSMYNVQTLIVQASYELPMLLCIWPDLIQLMDEDVVSLTGIMLLVNPWCRDKPRYVLISQLSLSLYLVTQCQLKLYHSVTALTLTLDYIEIARLNANTARTLQQLLLKLTERKALLYTRYDTMVELNVDSKAGSGCKNFLGK